MGQLFYTDLDKQVDWLVRLGLSPMEAIVAATRGGAEALGLTEQLGMIEPGRWADLILVDRDPLFTGDVRDATATALDFRLRPASPALELGFEPIPLEKIGRLRSEW